LPCSPTIANRTVSGTPDSAWPRRSVLTTCASTNQEMWLLVTSTAKVCHRSLPRFIPCREALSRSGRVRM
jgi:hypothetical protein